MWARTSLILKYELLFKVVGNESRLVCKRSVDEPMMGIPDRPESWPASRFFAVLGPAANVAQGSGTVVGRGVVSATPTATDHAIKNNKVLGAALKQ